ncbi:MAG: four helix bundle protein [Planctomycetes bacterium]|nr:four helix bundle protein [Planctomycetota bacterium]
MAKEVTKAGEIEKAFDLAERTAAYGEEVIRFARQLRLDAVSSPLVRQLVRSATSLGANYGEADEAGSKKEFRYRISLCCRESRECKHWLRMLSVACPDSRNNARPLWKEANELTRIFATIHRRSKPK